MVDPNDKSEPITLLLNEWADGDQEALDELMPYVYKELRRRAAAFLKHERGGHTLQTTALIHETYIKLADRAAIRFEDRNHFFAVAAKVMRRILVDYARKRNRLKRGGNQEDLALNEEADAVSEHQNVDLIALDDALSRLEEFDERLALVVELKYFGGMTIEETAEVTGVSAATIKRDWSIAKTWLRRQLSP